MPEHYQIVTVESVPKDEASILQALREIQAKKGPSDLLLLNYFKEMPVSFPATVNQVSSDLVELSVHPSQAVAMLHQKMAFLKSTHFPHDVVAKVQRVRMEKQMAVLARLAYAHIRSERREHVRVKVAAENRALFKCADVSIQGTVCDISLTGISILAAQEWDPGREVVGELRLSAAGALLTIAARLLRVLDHEGGKRYVLRLNPGKEERALAQFIFLQQTEVIKELKARS